MISKIKYNILIYNNITNKIKNLKKIIQKN